MIQSSINQMLNTAGYLATMSPDLRAKREDAKQAKDIVKTAEGSLSGLKDIESNLNESEKEYTQTQLEDIASRVKEHNRNINTAKTIGSKGHPLETYAAKAGVKRLPKQEEYLDTLKNIDANLEKRMNAINRIKEETSASHVQDYNFKKHMFALGLIEEDPDENEMYKNAGITQIGSKLPSHLL